jgi:hypothetical protein
VILVILFDLKCRNDHLFEGWFRDGAAFDEQTAGRKIACPICSSRKIAKAVMAPRIGKGSVEEAGEATRKVAVAMRGLAELRRKVEENCDYVGDRFAEEARRIHGGESDRHGIYGEATDEEAGELVEEGIEFARIPWVPRHQG